MPSQTLVIPSEIMNISGNEARLQALVDLFGPTISQLLTREFCRVHICRTLPNGDTEVTLTVP